MHITRNENRVIIRDAKNGRYIANLGWHCGFGAIHEALTIHFADRPNLNSLLVRIENRLYSIVRMDDSELPAIEIEAYS